MGENQHGNQQRLNSAIESIQRVYLDFNNYVSDKFNRMNLCGSKINMKLTKKVVNAD